MSFFSLKKMSKNSAPTSKRKIQFLTTPVEPANRSALTPIALVMRAPSPFPRVRKVKQFPAGSKLRVVVPSAKWRASARGRRPFLLEKGTPGADESSGPDTSSDEEKVRRKTCKPYYFSRKARYQRRLEYLPGDYVLVQVPQPGVLGRTSWRHGVVASFSEHPPRPEAEFSTLMRYAVTFEEYGRVKTEYFGVKRCGMLYDTLRSATARRA